MSDDLGEWLGLEPTPDPAREDDDHTEPGVLGQQDEAPPVQTGWAARNAARQAGERRRQAMIRHLRATRRT